MLDNALSAFDVGYMIAKSVKNKKLYRPDDADEIWDFTLLKLNKNAIWAHLKQQRSEILQFLLEIYARWKKGKFCDGGKVFARYQDDYNDVISTRTS